MTSDKLLNEMNEARHTLISCGYELINPDDTQGHVMGGTDSGDIIKA